MSFETGPIRPLARSASGDELYAVNTPDGQLEILDVTDAGLVWRTSVAVGLEPCAVAVAPDGRVWVVNHLSDSVSVVDVAAIPPRVVHTLLVGDEPRDIVFAGAGGGRAFVTTARRGQHRSDPSLQGVPGAGDPQLDAAGVPRADVWVFAAADPGAGAGGTPLRILSFFADTPRALAVSPAGDRVYVAAFHSGNQTTTIPELLVCDGFEPWAPCEPIPGVRAPGGLPGPRDNAFGDAAPETGLIVRFDPETGRFEDELARDWSPLVPYRLPDWDVFAFDADTLDPETVQAYAHVGTVLFGMTTNPTSGVVYVSNTEHPNQVRFEGPGRHGGSTVQGHLSEARITVIDDSGVRPRHLNKHLNYTRLHSDAPDLVDPGARLHSLATPLQPVVSGDGTTLYVAAFGSARIGVFSTAEIESDGFDPTAASAQAIPTGGGPSGLVLDEERGRLYVATRFDNGVAAIDLATRETFQRVALHDPEPAAVVAGRPLLYDALHTSGNGEASCASCHVFGDVDGLAWDLGNPDAPLTVNTQPPVIEAFRSSSFHPMKGPMLTQTLRGLATHGALHWRGDRVDGVFGLDPCSEVSGAPCDERHSFRNFLAAFTSLLGRDVALDDAEMEAFADFALALVPPPNPVRALDGSPSPAQERGLAAFERAGVDNGALACRDCHVFAPAEGLFGSRGLQSFEAEPQHFKVPQLRGLYARVGLARDGADQIRGYGLLHDGTSDGLARFLDSPGFQLTAQERLDLEQFLLATPTDLAPVVGQQVTLTASNAASAGPRIDLLREQAATPFESLRLGGQVTACDLVVKGVRAGRPRGWLYRDGAFFGDDGEPAVSAGVLRSYASDDAPLTYTCVPPGSGRRSGLDRDRDGLLDGRDNCPGAANGDQLDTESDGLGDACDPDDDDDDLLDAYETATGIFVSEWETGTHPREADSDGDGFGDGAEVASGSDPTDPSAVPVSEPAAALGEALALVALAELWRRRARPCPSPPREPGG